MMNETRKYGDLFVKIIFNLKKKQKKTQLSPSYFSLFF